MTSYTNLCLGSRLICTSRLAGPYAGATLCWSEELCIRFEMQLESSKFVLQDCFGYFRSFVFSYKI